MLKQSMLEHSANDSLSDCMELELLEVDAVLKKEAADSMFGNLGKSFQKLFE